MKITIDLTGLDGEELEKARTKAEKVIAQFVFVPNDVPVRIITGEVTLPNVNCISLSIAPKRVVFKDWLKDVAYLPLSSLMFEIRHLSGKESRYSIEEVIK